jgi:hypothetical protein
MNRRTRDESKMFPWKLNEHHSLKWPCLMVLSFCWALLGCGNLNSGGTSIDTETVALADFPLGGLPTEQSSGAFTSKDVQANTAENFGALRVDSAWFGQILRCDTLQFWALQGEVKGPEITWLEAQGQPHLWERRSRLWAQPQTQEWDVRDPSQAAWSARLWAQGMVTSTITEGQVHYRQRGSWNLGARLGRFELDSAVAIVRGSNLEHQGFGRFVDQNWQVQLQGFGPMGATPVLTGLLVDAKQSALGTLIWDSTGMRLKKDEF